MSRPTAALSFSLAATLALAAALALALAAPAQTQERRVIWDVFLWGQPRYDTIIIEALAEEVERRSEGNFTFNLLYESNIPPQHNLRMVTLRVAEAAMICLVNQPGEHPLATVLLLPFLPAGSGREERIKLARAVYEHPVIQAEFAKHKARVLLAAPRASLGLIGRGDVPYTAADFKDYPMLIPGHLAKYAVEYLQIMRVRLPSLNQIGESLAAGDIRAAALMPRSHQILRSHEEAEWWTANFNIGNLDCPVLVGERAFNELSPQYRAILDASIEAAYERAAPARIRTPRRMGEHPRRKQHQENRVLALPPRRLPAARRRAKRSQVDRGLRRR